MVLSSLMQQFITGFLVPNTVLWSSPNCLRAQGSSFRFKSHLGVGARCHVRSKCRLELRTSVLELISRSKVHASSNNWVEEGVDKSGDWNRIRSEKFSISVGAVAEAHNSQNTEVSYDGSDSLAAQVGPGPSDDQRWRLVKQTIAGLLSNARKQGIPQVRHSLGVDFGDAKTGVSISLKGYAPRPLTVVRMRGDKLIEQLLDIATREKADEFIVGLPRSSEGKETAQSNKTRSFAGRLAAQAALRGWRVYLQDEYGSSQDGLDYMLEMGVKKRSRKEMSDAYAAVALLSSYFNSKGERAQLVLPKGLAAQEQLCHGSRFGVGDNVGRVESHDFDEDNYEYED